MIKRRKMVVGAIVCLFGASILLLAVVLIAPKVIDSEVVKAKIRSEIKKTTGVEIDFAHLVLDFFPHPHITIDRAVMSISRVSRGRQLQ